MSPFRIVSCYFSEKSGPNFDIGTSTKMVYKLDRDHTTTYIELVNEIASHPDRYPSDALNAVYTEVQRKCASNGVAFKRLEPTAKPAREIVTNPNLMDIDSDEYRALVKAQKGILTKLSEINPSNSISVVFAPDFREKRTAWNSIISRLICGRSILPNELVLDFDYKDWRMNKSEGDKVLRFCKAQGFPNYCFFSGGKGLHIHLYYDHDFIPSDLLDRLRASRIDYYRLAREQLEKLIVSGSRATLDSRNIDDSVVSWSSVERLDESGQVIGFEKEPHLIRMVGCMRADGSTKTYLGDEIPSDKPGPCELPLEFPMLDEVEKVNLSDSFKQKLLDLYSNALMKKETEPDVSSIPVLANDSKRYACQSRIEAGIAEGNRNSAAFALAVHYKEQGLTLEQAQVNVECFIRNCDHCTEGDISAAKSTAKGVYNSPNARIQCKKIAGYGSNIDGEIICSEIDRQNCPKYIREVKKQDPNEVLANKSKMDDPLYEPDEQTYQALKQGQDWSILADGLHTKVIGEDRLLKLYTLSALSTKLKEHDQFHISTNASSQMGKSYTAEAVADMLFSDITIFQQSFSAKSFFYKSMLDPFFLKGKLLQLDEIADVSPEARDMLKPLYSNTHADGITHSTVIDGKPVEMTIKACPVIWSNSAKLYEDSLNQLSNRVFKACIDESKEQTQRIVQAQKEEGKYGKAPSNAKVVKGVKAVKAIKEFTPADVFIPLADVMNVNGETRNLVPMFKAMVRSCAYMHHYSRPKMPSLDGDGEILIATFDDIQEAQELWNSFATQRNGGYSGAYARVVNAIKEFYRAYPHGVGEDGYPIEATDKNITEQYNKLYKESPISTKTIKNYLTDLCDRNAITSETPQGYRYYVYKLIPKDEEQPQVMLAFEGIVGLYDEWEKGAIERGYIIPEGMKAQVLRDAPIPSPSIEANAEQPTITRNREQTSVEMSYVCSSQDFALSEEMETAREYVLCHANCSPKGFKTLFGEPLFNQMVEQDVIMSIDGLVRVTHPPIDGEF